MSILKRPQLFSFRRSISQLSVPLKQMQRHSQHGDMTEAYELSAKKELERISTQIRGCR